jgi:Ala-tRNA(Pro) deacylase
MNLTRFLDLYGVPYQHFQHDQTYDAQHLAQSLHVSGRNIAKTVMVRTNIDGFENVVLVVPATKRVDLQRASKALGADVGLATESEMLNQCPGCEFGVVPIFGSKFGMETIVDKSMAEQEEIVFQGDTHEEAIRMKYSDFHAVEHPLVASIVGS